MKNFVLSRSKDLNLLGAKALDAEGKLVELTEEALLDPTISVWGVDGNHWFVKRGRSMTWGAEPPQVVVEAHAASWGLTPQVTMLVAEQYRRDAEAHLHLSGAAAYEMARIFRDEVLGALGLVPKADSWGAAREHLEATAEQVRRALRTYEDGPVLFRSRAKL